MSGFKHKIKWPKRREKNCCQLLLKVAYDLWKCQSKANKYVYKMRPILKGPVKKYRGGGGGAGAFGNVVDKKHITHPLPSAQK